MKINIGINIFGDYHRQDLCIQSLIKLKKKYPNIITLYNIQDIKETKLQKHDEFININTFLRSSKDVVKNSTKNLPIVNEFFNTLSGIEGDYFIFLNSDIILNDKIIEFLLETNYDCIPISRLAIENIQNLNEQPKHSHYQVAGFDAYAVKSVWWRDNWFKFPEYIYAISAWDVDFGARMMIEGNTYFYNKWPPTCFHIIHEEKSHNDTPERQYNVNLFFNENKEISNKWNSYLFNVLLKRPGNNYVTSHKNELILEKKYFK